METKAVRLVRQLDEQGELEMSEESGRKSWLGATFGAIFFLAGLLFALGFVGPMVYGYVATANWVEVPATIHHLELETVQLDDSTRYLVASEYSYSFNGANYENDRVSLSTTPEYKGGYWHDLYASLSRKRDSGKAIVYVNPGNSGDSLLDRPFRWSLVIVPIAFMFIFSGLGGFIIWASLCGSKYIKREQLLEAEFGIACRERPFSLILVIIGGIFFTAGAAMSAVSVAQVFRTGEYSGLLALLFPAVGAGVMFYGFKLYRTYKRFGTTRLQLDPPSPGVGGQLGGTFAINNPAGNQNLQAETTLNALLICARRSRADSNGGDTVIWQEEAPVHLMQTAQGIKGQFIFDVPDHCLPTNDEGHISTICWRVVIEGNINHANLGKFDRSWGITVTDAPAQTTNVLSIPEPFLRKAEEKYRAQAKASAVDQIPITESTDYIEVLGKAGRHPGSKLMALLFGAMVCGIGFFTVSQEWWPGYIFLFVGGLVIAATIFAFGKALEVKIDKHSKIIYTRKSWCGFVFSHQQGELFDSAQFKIEKTSTMQSGNKAIEFYALNFFSEQKNIRIADQIAGKKTAVALRDLIIDRCFEEPPRAKVA